MTEKSQTLREAMVACYRQHRFVRFLMVGSLNTGFSYSVYALFLFFGLSYPIANLISLICGIFFSFYTQGKFVFRNTHRKLFLRFVAVWGLIYLVNVIVIGVLVHVGLNAYIAGAIALAPVTLLSYLLQKVAVFGRG